MVPFALLLHNVEEGLTMASYVPRLEQALGVLLGRPVALPGAAAYHFALVVVTGLAFAAYGIARLCPPATYALVVLQAVMALNVLTHLGGSLLLRGYAPGVLTAVTVEAPTSWLVYRRVRHAAWMGRRQRVWLVPLALALHGPLLFALLAWARSR